MGVPRVSSNGATNRISSLGQMKLLDLQEIKDAASRENLAASAAATNTLLMLRAYRKMFDTVRIGNLFNIVA